MLEEAMRTVAIAEAQARLPELIAEVADGEEVVISLDNGSAFQIVRRTDLPRPRFGSARGMFTMADDFDEPLEDLAPYEG
jgi:prevent-host-death family protein